MKLRQILQLVFGFGLALPAGAAPQPFKMEGKPGEAPGPWIFATIGVGKNADGTAKTTALKGLAIKAGEHEEATFCYDLDLCRMAGAWTGGFTTPMNLMSRGETPQSIGEVAVTTGEIAGFRSLDLQRLTEEAKRTPASGATPGIIAAGHQSLVFSSDSRHGTAVSARIVPPLAAWKDPRSEPFGPLPDVKFRGMYVDGGKTILKWEAGGAEILESPGYLPANDAGQPPYFTRTFNVGPIKQSLLIVVAADPNASLPFPEARSGASGEQNAASWTRIQGHICLLLPASDTTFRCTIGTAQGLPRVLFLDNAEDLTAHTHGGPARWPEPVVTQGQAAADTAPAYVVDTVGVPDKNPWNAPMFIGGFDFFPDGRAAVCTFHGDVFIVSGLDGKLDHVTWRRFASGLYHALGLKIVDGEIYVTCRDGITRLKDLNGDGEADFYERFNNDLKVTKSFHEFVFDLQTDRAGNFYFAKAGPVKNGGRGFDEIMDQHGTLMRVSADGRELSVVATGFRAPNGIGISPDGQLTSSDNEGTWTPACKIDWIEKGGFYGCVPTAHRDPAPTSYDKPLCWMPKRVDNSSGGQVWAPEDDRWGPWRGELLHLSYGQCTLLGVLKEQVQDPTKPDCCDVVMQGGVVQFPLKFQSGIMRARFNPADGQLYVAGLRGWQTTALKNGCLQRVRYTGAQVDLPIRLHVKRDGIEIQFACTLNTQKACDPDNWNVEVWNYVWSSAYGSPEVSTVKEAEEKPSEPGKDGALQYTASALTQKHHDTLAIKSITAGTDDRTVFLEIPGLKPVMQMSIKYQIKAHDDADLHGEIVNTINGFGE